MQHEIITLTSGEVRIVERSTSQAGSLYINIWATRNERADQEEAEIRKVRLTDSRFEPAIASIRNKPMKVADFARHIEILQHAARLAAELDEQFKPGTEVA